MLKQKLKKNCWASINVFAGWADLPSEWKCEAK